MIYRQPYIFFSVSDTDPSYTGDTSRHKDLVSILDTAGKPYQEISINVDGVDTPAVMINYTPENHEIVDSLARDFGIQEYFSLSCNNEFCVHTPNQTFVYDSYSVSDTKPLGDHIVINDTTYIHG